MRYTKEVLSPLVQNSLSVAEVMRKLGLKHFNGGTHSHITGCIKKFAIDSNHFLGQARNQGSEHIGGNDKICWQLILVKNRLNERKEKCSRLRTAMLESGIKWICNTCNLQPEWNDKPLVLQISHKDGDSLNNERSNLQFECPNCHSQTDDYGGKSAGKKSR